MTALPTLRLMGHPSTLVAVASLLLAAGCSAPPGADEPRFNAFVPSAAGTPGAANGPGPAGASPSAATPGAGGSTASSNEQTGSNGGIGLNPVQPSDQSQGGGGSAGGQGTGGSTMVGVDPNANGGAAGSSFDPGATGSAGSTSMPPSGGNPQQPPAPQDPAPSGDCAGAFFCDGFESVADGASPTAAVWSIIESFSPRDQSALVQVSSDNARSGGQALRVTGSGGRTGVIAALPRSTYFVRAFFQLDAVPRGPVFIGAGVDQNNETRFRIQGESIGTINTTRGDAVRPANANGGACPDCVTLAPNEWFCAEMFIDNDAQTATLWIDGDQAAVAGPDAFTAQPAAPNLFFGSWGLQGGITGVWIDDVAVGPERFGCN
jgi:hypothetical protein